MATFIRQAARAADRDSQIAALRRAADRATPASGISTTLVRVDDRVFVARGIEGEPLRDKDLRQTLANTDGGDVWFGHLEGRGALKTALWRVVGLRVGGTAVLVAGAKLALGIDPGISAQAGIMTMLAGATVFGVSAVSVGRAKSAERALDQLVVGGTAKGARGAAKPLTGKWTYGNVVLRKQPQTLSLAAGQPMPSAVVTERERITV